MSYTRPEEVHSPKGRWNLVEVIIDKGPENCAYALGLWDGHRCIGFRWNGSDDNPLGNPQSRGLATWIVLDDTLYPAVIAQAPKEKQTLISSFLKLPRRIELVVDRHPSGNLTLKEREEGEGMYRDLSGDLLTNSNAGTFYRAVAREIGNRLESGQHVRYSDTATGGK